MASDRTYRVLTAVGSDRPGLVSEVSKILHGQGVNLEDSRMAVLGGEFALMLLISGEDSALSQAETEVADLAQRLELKVLVKPTSAARASGETIAYRLQVIGLDHPGIVKTISSLLAAEVINVSAMDTRVVHAPHTGTPTFQLQADLEIPGTVQLKRLREALAHACEEDNLDFALEARRG